MKTRHISALLLVPLLFLLSSCAPETARAEDVHSDVQRETAPHVEDADLAGLVAGNNEFAFALYKQIDKRDANLIYSPYSVSIALAMTYAGARGQTAEQMAQVMHFTLPQDRLHPAFNRLALELESRSKSEDIPADQAFQLSVANSLWGQSGYPFEQDFLDVLALNYAAGMGLVDFERDPEGARLAINDWVYRKTEEKIEDIIPAPPPDLINRMTRLVLANAVYFKAAWLSAFEPEATQSEGFFLIDGSRIEVPIMRQQAGFSAMQGEGYRAVEIPYVGRQASMVILLPDEGKYSDVEGRLDGDFLNETLAAMNYGEVSLGLPKFKFEWSDDLVNWLQALGMADAFDPASADFSGMTGERGLYISAVLHKAFVAVDEAGTEAAAATVVIMLESAMPAGSVEFTIDRPFFFVIRDNPTGSILFLGRVMNPTA